MRLKVTYFFRKPFQDYHSIEGVFKNVQEGLDSRVQIKNYYLKRYSKGILNRVLSCFEVLKHQGDINHITGDIHFVSYLLPKKRTLLTIHDLAPLRNSNGIKHAILKLFWYQFPIWSVKYVTVISEFTKKELSETLKINPIKIKVIPNPVPVGIAFQPKSEISGKPVLLQVGTAYNKNLEGLIEAISGMEVKLIIIGTLSENQINLLKTYKIDYSNDQNISYDEVLEAYKTSDIVCFATFYEGFGLPILEAQAVGRPVITSNRCAMPETAGKGAILINPENTNEYAKAIKELIQNEDKRKKLVGLGRDNLNRFSSKSVSNAYLKLYEQMHEELR